MGKRAFRDVHPKEFVDREVEQLADALLLRGLRAVPGVWQLPVWEQADDINSECGFLESELEDPLKEAVGGGALILADDREANKAWCVDWQESFLYLTFQLL